MIQNTYLSQVHKIMNASFNINSLMKNLQVSKLTSIFTLVLLKEIFLEIIYQNKIFMIFSTIYSQLENKYQIF